MAILIDMDMDIPGSCGVCPIYDDEIVCCSLGGDEYDCPLREVVRCKECKRYESDGGAFMTCTLHDLIVEDECFCWWGERREE